MKNTHKCPKCASKEVYKVPVEGSFKTGTGLFALVPISRYVCADCGFSEEWTLGKNLEDFKKNALKNGWKKLNEEE